MKNLFKFIIFMIIISMIIIKGIERFEKIENGDLILINQNQMDR